jgi:hypothetical protein
MAGSLAIGCGGSSHGDASGKAAALGLRAGLAAAAHARSPWRCARGIAATQVIAPHADGSVRIGVVADARGATPATLAALAAIRDEFTRAGVDVVVTAGGMATSDADLGQALDALAGAWPVIAVPGDREAVPALRRAVAASNGRVVDGSAAVFVIGGLALATIGGAPAAARLAAGAEGCTRDRADLDAVLGRLRAATPSGHRPARVLIAATAPRGHGDDASDRSRDGVHVGELDLAGGLVDQPIDLVVHPEVTDGPVAGHVALGAAPAARAIPAGVAAAAARYDRAGQPRRPTATLLTLDGDQLRWQPVPATGATLPPRP